MSALVPNRARTVLMASVTYAVIGVGPVRSHWSADDFWRTAVLSLPLWPVLTGIPAFLAALLGGSILGRLFGSRTGQLG